MNYRISSRGAFLVIVALLVLAAVGYSLSFGTLVPADYTFVNATEIKTVDPAIATGVPEHRILSAIFEGLTEWEPKNLEPVPGVAESWEISDDKKTYTFRLRNNAKWTDGTPVTAHDFIYSWRRFLHPATAAEYSYEMWYVVNAERFNKRQIQAGDEVEIELPQNGDDGGADALPFAPGKIVKGKLLAIQAPASDSAESTSADWPQKDQENSDAAVYLVEINGQERRFHNGGMEGEDYAWMLLDFDSVGVRALDERTLEVKLRHPVPYFPTLCGYYPYSPVNRTCVETYGRDWTKPENIVTNGAFRLETRRLRDRIRMVKSDNYWDRDNVRLNVVDAVAVESHTTSLNLYLTGQVDWFEYVPNAVVPALLAQKRSDFQPSPYNTTYFYRLNVTEPPLDDARVRRALNMAINKQDIVDSILRAGQEPARSMVPTVTATHSKYKPALCEGHNVERARELLAEAGYPEGRGFPKLEVQYNTNDTHSAVAELIQSQWQQALGIRIELKGLEWNVYHANQTNKTYDISRAGWVGDYPDPNTFLKLWLSTSGHNRTGWGNAQYDALVAKAQQEADDAKRAEFFHLAEAILMRELPILPLYFYVSTSMSKPYVKGYYHNLQDFHPIKYIWIDAEEKARYGSEASP
jgi:oligopeptide transport system substrate-binding protein